MKLINLVQEIEQIDENLIIFLRDIKDINSDLILSQADEKNEGNRVINGVPYHYLIEIFLAKEFLKDWVDSINGTPSDAELAKRLFEYAINDA